MNILVYNYLRAFMLRLGSRSKEWTCNPGNTGDMGLIPGSGKSPGKGNGNSFQYSCLKNPTDRGTWQSIVQRVRHHWVTKHKTKYIAHAKIISMRWILQRIDLKVWRFLKLKYILIFIVNFIEVFAQHLLKECVCVGDDL